MRSKKGLRGMLSVIALGMAISSPGVVQAQSDGDLAALCDTILSTKTRAEFLATAAAVAALGNDNHVCHTIAVAHWASLGEAISAPPTGAPTLTTPVDSPGPGYTFQ